MRKSTLLFLCQIMMAGSLTAGPSVIDSTAYTRWHRADNASLSDNGQWLKYRYVYINNDAKNKENAHRFHFWNNQNGKTLTLDSIADPQFLAQGEWMTYTDTRPAHKDEVYFMHLQSRKKIPWLHKESPRYDEDCSVVGYTDKEKTAVFCRLGARDSVRYEKMGFYQLMDQGRKILYIQKTEEAHLLKYGNLQKPLTHCVIFEDTDRKLDRFDYSDGKGQFTIDYEVDKVEYARYYRFDLNGEATLITDTRDWNIAPEMRKKIQHMHALGNGTLWEVKIAEPQKRAKRRSKKEEEALRDSSFSLQLWSWNDPIIQSEQAVRGYREKRPEPDLYIYNLKSGQLQKVLSGQHGDIQPVDEPAYVLLADHSANEGMGDWRHKTRYNHVLVELATGKKHPFSQEQLQRPFWSKNGDYVIFYDDHSKEWKQLNPATLKIASMTAAIPYPMFDEQYDKPHAAPPYGLGAWSEDGTKAYLYDRYDIWEISMDDVEHPVCYTKGLGRKEETSLRFLSINYETNLTVPANGLMRLTLDNEKTGACGLGHLNASGKLKKDLYGDFCFSVTAASKDRRYLVLNRQSFAEGRNIWLFDTRTNKCRKVSNANPNHNGYEWGSVKLIEWTNYAGEANKGLLYLPVGYEEGKKYPMVVNYYESHAGEQHVYYMPDWCSAMLDVPTFLSHGYIVFKPDVYFKQGYMAQSTYDAVVSGVEHLVKEGIATPGKIGVQGHSWSGCTVANLITMTDIFRCASIGAGVVNMTESYTALRIGSGNTRMFMYEDWQSRIGKSLWEDPEAYLRNSAIFRVNHIQSPVLIMHNDQDEAVEYHEGRNLYLAMRRLQKPVWLLNYEGQGHFVMNPAAQRDWSRRMLQFFDYYLKGSAIPRWMKEGINVNEKNIDRKLDLVEE